MKLTPKPYSTHLSACQGGYNVPVKDRPSRHPKKRTHTSEVEPTPRAAKTGTYVNGKPAKTIHIYTRVRQSSEGGTARDTEDMKTADEKRSLTPEVIGTLTTAAASFSLLGGIPFGLPGVIVGALVGFTIGAVNQKDKLFTTR